MGRLPIAVWTPGDPVRTLTSFPVTKRFLTRKSYHMLIWTVVSGRGFSVK